MPFAMFSRYFYETPKHREISGAYPDIYWGGGGYF